MPFDVAVMAAQVLCPFLRLGAISGVMAELIAVVTLHA
jgi:hypothetical protein